MTTDGASAARRVFCSHRSVDKPAVLAFAERLRASGIDAWLDEWEIRGGDDVVRKINEGLESCDFGLVFFSSATATGAWVGGEISALVYRMIEDGLPVLPVMIDTDAVVPALLRPRSRRAIEDFDVILDAILGRSRKPPLSPAPETGRTDRLVLRLHLDARDRLSVDADLNNQLLGVIAAHFPGHLHRSYAEFLQGRLKLPTRGPALDAAILEQGLLKLGRELGETLFPGIVGQALAELLNGVRVGITLELVFQGPGELLGLPFEAARLRDGRLPALEPGVSVLRRFVAADPEPAAMAILPGPLKILVAVGAPDEGQTPNTVLDLEAELQAILEAVERAGRFGNAQMRVLEVGHPGTIYRALCEDSFHVLHLSGHGLPGALELEDEEGHAVRVNAADLAAALRASGRPLPLVFLSSCHGGTTGVGTASFAQGLLEAGVPQVVAMQGTVTDSYATRLAGVFYGELIARADRPLASRALAAARRVLETERRSAIARGAPAAACQPEFATASLFCRGPETPVLDLSLPLDPLRVPPVHRVEGPVPQLSLGELVGRRRELRELLRTLRDDPRSVAEHGRRSGVVLTGLGGVGKSSIAGRAMMRLREEGWIVAALNGTFDPTGLAEILAAALEGSEDDWALKHATRLRAAVPHDIARLQQILSLLQTRRVVLVLDNFESNLRVGGSEFLDPVVADWTRELCERAEIGRLLFTSRHPLPGLGAWLREIAVGPLSPAQTRKLALRHEGLRNRPPEEFVEVLRRIGGHPRMLEYLDALLRGGRARLPRVQERLEAMAREAGVESSSSVDRLEHATANALLVGAQDILLGELLVIADEAGIAEVLRQAAVSSLPWNLPDLAHALHGRPADERELAAVRAACDHLCRISLLTPREDDEVEVHRWTAESLRGLADPEKHRERCRRGGHFRLWRMQHEESGIDAIEAVRNLLEACSFDEACVVADQIVEALSQAGHIAGAATLATEVLRSLPTEHSFYGRFADLQGKAYLALGYTQLALRRYQTLLEHIRARADYPDHADHQRNLSLIFERIGSIHSDLGNGEMARQAYEESLSIIERLAAAEPERADYQYDLSRTLGIVGDLHRITGRGEAARQAHERSIAIIERLVKNEPARSKYQRALAGAHFGIGDDLSALGDLKAARNAYEQSLAIIERLAAGEPDRADYQRELAASNTKIGDLQRALGEVEAAQEAYERSRAIIERLANSEPDRTDYQRDLGLSFERLGDIHRDRQQLEVAHQAYERSLAIRERLVAAEPERADYQRYLAFSCIRVGYTYAALGRMQAARQAYERSLAIRERLAAAEPERADFQFDLAVSFEWIGDLEHESGHSEEARRAHRRSLAIRKRLAAAEPNRADYIQHVAISLLKVADQEPDHVLDYLTEALEILAALYRESRLDAKGRHLLQIIYDRVAGLGVA